MRTKGHAPMNAPAAPAYTQLATQTIPLRCPRCPPNLKTFKTEFDLKMHLQTKFHAPPTPVSQPEVSPEDKGKGKAPEQPTAFSEPSHHDDSYVGPGDNSVPYDTVDSPDDDSGGMNMAGVPLDMSWADQANQEYQENEANRKYQEYEGDEADQEYQEYQEYHEGEGGDEEQSAGMASWIIGIGRVGRV